MNRVTLLGNLGADPEVRYSQSGTPIANLRLATNEKWKTKDGEPREHTEWHRVVVFGPTAENCGKYLAQGRQVLVEGKIRTNKWQDNDGNDRYSTEIVASNVQFLGGGSGQQESPSKPAGGFEQSFSDDDIPF